MYLHPFHNQYRDRDFTLISDTIKEYFPVDKPKRLTSRTVASSPGFKKIGKIAEEEFLDQKAYRGKWGKLTSNLKKVFKKSVRGYPDLSGGGFFGEVIIEEDKKPDFIRQKSLRFYISILGPFFSIHAVDSSIALLEIESNMEGFKGNFEAIHAITISPVFEYQEVFSKLENELRAFFPGYLFVPYQIGMSTMKNISIADELRGPRTMDTVYEALFGTRAVHDCLRTRGDRYYGMDDWVKSLTKRETSLKDLISQHIIAAPPDTTVHKVWKLQESKRLETFNISGNLMFGIDLFDVIDLTDKSTLMMMSKERGAPSSGKYKIKDDVIEINSNYSLRIVELSKERLTLHLILNFERKDVSVKGEALEMKFIEMKKIE